MVKIKYVASAADGTGDYTADGVNDQIPINQALLWAYNNGTAADPATVYLKGSFVFGINNQVLFGSNTVLTGDKTACLKVPDYACGNNILYGQSGAYCVFPDGKPVITQMSGKIPFNVEISNIEINGNCQHQYTKLGLAHGTPSSAGSGVERLIGFGGSSTSPVKNINIHHIHSCDAFGETARIYYGQNIQVHDCKCENHQHDTIFYICVTGSGNIIANNTVEGITSDCLRLDNCQNVDVYGNYLTPYLGPNNNGAAEHGENGIQIGDESNKPISTNNINIYNNSIINQGIAGIWLDGALSNTSNVYIHDNTINDNGWSCWVNYCAGISIGPWGNGIVIEDNSFDGNWQNAIQVLSARSSSSNYTVTVRGNSISNTRGQRIQSAGNKLPSGAVGYGIYNAFTNNNFTINISGNTFVGNLKGDHLGNVKDVSSYQDYLKISSQLRLHANEPSLTDGDSFKPVTYLAMHAGEPILIDGYDLKPKTYLGMYASDPTFYEPGKDVIVPGTKGIMIPSGEHYLFQKVSAPFVGDRALLYPACDNEYYLLKLASSSKAGEKITILPVKGVYYGIASK